MLSNKKTILPFLSFIVLVLTGCGKQLDKDVEKTEQVVPATPEVTMAASNPELPEQLKPCVQALLNTKVHYEEWKKGLNNNCDHLNPDEEKLASDAATELSGQVEISGFTRPRIRFWNTPKESIGAFEKGDLPYGVVSLSEDEEWLAMQGNYQAQRNYAYSVSETNPIAACAWRIAIVSQGHYRVDTTDTENLKVYCERLSPLNLQAAELQSKTLIENINKTSNNQ